MFRPLERLSKKPFLKCEPLVHIHEVSILGVRLASQLGPQNPGSCIPGAREDCASLLRSPFNSFDLSKLASRRGLPSK